MTNNNRNQESRGNSGTQGKQRNQANGASNRGFGAMDEEEQDEVSGRGGKATANGLDAEETGKSRGRASRDNNQDATQTGRKPLQGNKSSSNR